MVFPPSPFPFIPSVAMSDTISGQARSAYPDGQPAKVRAAAADGRAGGRPVRRRTRASRRAPTTMFDTDASNFRAMVQQFTGLPSGPYATGGGGYDSYIHEPFLYNQQPQRSFVSFGPSHSQEEQYQSYNSDHNIVAAMTGGGSYSNNNDAAVLLQGLANYGTNFGVADEVFFRQTPTDSSASIHHHM